MSMCIHKRCFMGCINKLFSKSFEYLFGKLSLSREIISRLELILLAIHVFLNFNQIL